jgi:hypothetical protein
MVLVEQRALNTAPPIGDKHQLLVAYLLATTCATAPPNWPITKRHRRC